MSESKSFYYVVDDEPIITSMVSAILTDAGNRVESCNDSTKALQNIIDSKPDCILLDIMMPGLDGLELCRQIREQATLTDVCIIMFSAKS